MNKKLKRDVWGKDKYWALAEKGSLDTEHPGMKLLFKITKGKKDILDLGCGEGTRLSLISGKGKSLTGIDISDNSIERARTKYPRIKFISGNIEKLPFPDESFDLVYSAFVFEHLDKPEKVISEAIRVLKKGGNLLIMAPNYGAPNRASPPFNGSRIKKLLNGFIADLSRPMSSPNSLVWKRVTPIADADSYEMDWDTTVEPYLGSLVTFIEKLKMKRIKSFSSWEEERDGVGIVQKIFRVLGEMEIYPFTNWGPHLVILVEK
jgi:ubiquinone/menaquinone biosynthesis C-methylase UbiE